MRIDWWTLALQAINVLILVWLLARFLFRPVMDAIAARQAAAGKLLADAQAARDAAAAQQESLKARADGFAAEAQTQRQEMQASVEAERARMLDRAKIEAAAVSKQAMAVAEADRARMQAELEEKAAVLAGEMAARLLRRLPVREIERAMLAVLLERVRAQPEDRRAALAADTPITVVTAAPLSAETREECLKQLTDILPGLPAPDFAADPALIAGFEIRGPHSLVRNSWRSDLDDLLASLKEDDHARIG
ncbi:F0F1 ATP synthase subunit B family protein [Sphingomonas oryzagri]